VTANTVLLERVAPHLASVSAGFVYLGGAVVDLLLTDPASPEARPTDDVDTIVEVGSTSQYYQLAERLRAAGFKEDTSPGAPLCRWIVAGTKVDIMPTEAGVLGFSNRWYPSAIRHAEPVQLGDGSVVQIVTAPHFVATKLEAFRSRGAGRFRDSADIEDIVAVVDGRPELGAEVARAPPDLRRHLSLEFSALLSDPLFLDALPGHLPSDAASQARRPLLLARLRAITSTPA
jgi:predicted nucleotidyltransferase